jgi:hypothetical protein
LFENSGIDNVFCASHVFPPWFFFFLPFCVFFKWVLLEDGHAWPSNTLHHILCFSIRNKLIDFYLQNGMYQQ